MKFYTKTHKNYCGIDLHTKKMFVCIIDSEGNILIHKNIDTDPQRFLKLINPFKDDIVVGVECMFSWYWIADLCKQEGLDFILGHALYMKAIHGGKTKSDKIDSEKIARLIRGGTFPMAYVYPAELRPVRDLLRRRHFLVRTKSEAIAHTKITNHQYNNAVFEKNIAKKGNRTDLGERFSDTTVRMNVEVDLAICDFIHDELNKLENHIVRHAIHVDARTFHRLQTVTGIGKILGLTIMYEIGDINRFPNVGSFCSYARLVKCSKESAGKLYGYGGGKMGNAHLKWAFSEATILFMRQSDRAKAYVAKLEKKHGKGKAMSILAHKLGRAVYYILKRKDSFDENYFFSQ